MSIAEKKRVLFICTHNAGRSQMAEAIVNHMYCDRYEARSGGTRPSAVNPYVVRAMSEVGIDISSQRSKHLDEFGEERFDLVVTLCSDAEDNCPFFPGGEHIHQGFGDPSALTGTDEAIMRGVREIRDDIARWIRDNF